MTDRERLIELIDYVLKFQPWGEIGYHTSKELADYLLANGVIVPPCKVGDTVYEFGCTDPFGGQLDLYVVESTVSGIAIFTTKDIHNMNCFGKTVFLTKEEAEEKLKEINK